MMQHSHPMNRRSLLKLGAASAALLATLGAGVALTTKPGFDGGVLSASARDVVAAVARAVLDGRLPNAEPARDAALSAHLARFEAAIANFPRAVQGEISELLMVLGTAPGRLALAGLRPDWREAGVNDVQASLQAMRVSPWALRAQAYHALRDLTNGAYYADASTWGDLRYPGPKAV